MRSIEEIMDAIDNLIANESQIEAMETLQEIYYELGSRIDAIDADIRNIEP